MKASEVGERQIVWHRTSLNREDRQKIKGHKSCVIWMTGLSGSGKSTLANALEVKLHALGVHSYLLDGDNVRHGLNRDLGFSPDERKENIRRTGEVAKLFVDAGMIVITALISPFRSDRAVARQMVAEGEFVEVYVKCPLAECENRDPKGLYKKARAGVIPEFTGISSPYEAPEHPELVLETDKLSVEIAVEQLIGYLQDKGII